VLSVQPFGPPQMTPPQAPSRQAQVSIDDLQLTSSVALQGAPMERSPQAAREKKRTLHAARRMLTSTGEPHL
jgi:hypothetical protein